MSSPEECARARPAGAVPQWVKNLGWGYLYWVAVLIALEPGNLDRGLRAGNDIAFHLELVRILGAAALGAAVTPVLLSLATRYPLTAGVALRNALVRVAALAALSAILNVVSCFLAAWLLAGDPLPTRAAVREQLAGNWILLLFVMGGLLVVFGHVRRAQPAAFSSTIPVRNRGRTELVHLREVDWVETHGNYVALHVGARSHLVRQTAASLEPHLRPLGFLRVHRRALVNVNRIAEMRSLTNGDALLVLRSGAEVRVSRRYREATHHAWAAGTSD